MRATALLALAILLAPVAGLAHHGVASLGVAGLEGPGAPVETSSSATLPQGSLLAFLKLDHAVFETYTDAVDGEGASNAFWMYGLGWGIRPWLSAYAVLPYYAKKVEDNSFNSAGFADMSLMGVIGLKWDAGLHLVPANESLDDLEDWHFTLYGGLTLPTGDADLEDANGAIDPGMSLGFGTPSTLAGVTATKQLTGRVTAVADASWIGFGENTYADGQKVRFGTELRANLALTARLLTLPERRFRLDANLEGNYLQLGRDEADGVGEDATGGAILYVLPGLRAYYRGVSLGLGVKLPAWTDLNEADDQQGAEGKEDYRLVVSFSTLM